MRRQSTGIRLFSAAGDFIRWITLTEARRQAENDGDLRILCRHCLRSTELSRCQANFRGHEMVAQLSPAATKQQRVGNSKASITRGEMERNAFGKAFTHLGPTDSIRAIERAIDKVESWPSVFNDKTVGIAAGVVVNATFMREIPENMHNFA